MDSGPVAMGHQFFHGGCRGLEPGDELLPPSKTGVSSVSGSGGAPYRRDRIYLTETVNEARSYAALYVPPLTLDALGRREQVTLDDFGGDLYEVEVIGKVVADRDYAEAVSERSWEAACARVICVLERRVPPDLSVLSHP